MNIGKALFYLLGWTTFRLNILGAKGFDEEEFDLLRRLDVAIREVLKRWGPGDDI